MNKMKGKIRANERLRSMFITKIVCRRRSYYMHRNHSKRNTNWKHQREARKKIRIKITTTIII